MADQAGLSRRDVLKLGGATGTLTAMAGCLGWITGGSESGDDDETSDEEENEQSKNGNENTDNGTNTTEETDSGEDTNGNTNEDTNQTEENNTGGDGNENESANETETEEQEEEEPLTPDENETEVNESQYEDQDEREITERPKSDVEVTAEAEKVGDGLVLKGEVKNVSEEYVDTVDLDISIYDENEAYIGADIVSVGDLEPGDTKPFERTLSATELQGEPSNIQINVTVYGPA